MESLRYRNEKLAAEVSRLRSENKLLKIRVNKYENIVYNITLLYRIAALIQYL